jgi:hypothetical protein
MIDAWIEHRVGIRYGKSRQIRTRQQVANQRECVEEKNLWETEKLHEPQLSPRQLGGVWLCSTPDFPSVLDISKFSVVIYNYIRSSPTRNEMGTHSIGETEKFGCNQASTVKMKKI